MYMQPEPLQIYLNKQQLKKFQTQKSFQLSNAQLASGTGLHRVQIQLHPHHHKRLLSSASKNKGFRFSPDTIQGGSVIGSIKGAASKVGSTLQKVGSTIKRYVPKEVVKIVAKKGADIAGTYFDKADLAKESHQLIDAGIDGAYAYGGMVNHNMEHTTGVKLHKLRGRPAVNKNPLGHLTDPHKERPFGNYFGGDLVGDLQSVKNYFGGSLTDDLEKCSRYFTEGKLSGDIDTVRHYMNLGMGKRLHVIGGNFRHGVPTPIYTRESIEKLHKIGSRNVGTGNGLLHGGSFLPL